MINSIVLLELAARWEADAKQPKFLDGSPEAVVRNAIEQGERQAKRECADTLRTLVELLERKAGNQ